MKFRDVIFTILGVLVGLLMVRFRLVFILKIYAIYFIAKTVKNIISYRYNKLKKKVSVYHE